MTIKTKIIDATIRDKDGNIISGKENFEVPDSWSETAARIAASKYATNSETSVLQIFDRVSDRITEWGKEDGYFKGNSGETFNTRLKDILYNQRACFNSPVLFNVGTKGHKEMASACFIFPVEDNMEDILEHTKREGMVFKWGGGSGINASKIRAKGEELSNKGTSSGVTSFLRIWDKCAGSIRSGGSLRRSAKMVILDIDHPDIEEFIDCKSKEEEKAKLLIEAGIPIEEAYSTVDFQNENHSIGITDHFMQAVQNDLDWSLTNRKNKKVAKKVRAKELFRKIAKRAHETGDPGLFFIDRVNKDNPIPLSGRIYSSNPCVHQNSLIFTENGFKKAKEIKEGDKIQTSLGLQPVDRIEKHKNYPTYKITFSDGFSQIVTEGHIFHSMNAYNGQKIWTNKKRLLDLKPGGFIRKQPYCKIPRLTNYTRDEGLLIGLYLGDGCYSNYCCFNISVNSLEDNTYISNLYKRLGGRLRIDKGEGNCERYYFLDNNKILNNLFNKLSINANNKTFDLQKLLNSNKEFVYGIIDGLISSDGNINLSGKTRQIRFKNTSLSIHKLLQQLFLLTQSDYKVYLFSKAGEVRKIYDREVTRKKDCYEGVIGADSILNLYNHIQYFSHPNKNKVFEEIIKTTQLNGVKWKTKVVSIEKYSSSDVYDFYCKKTDDWNHEGYVSRGCGEFVAIDSSSCNLASLNLVKYLDKNGYLIEDLIKKDIKAMITAMDIIVGNAEYPTEEVKRITKATRPLGLGFSNLGTALIKKGLAYNSSKGREWAKSVIKFITFSAYEQSIYLARKLGSYEYFEANKETNINLATRLTGSSILEGDIEKYGLRNSQLTLLAPCGTIGWLMDCEALSIEPIFASKQVKQLVGGGTIEIEPECIKEYKALSTKKLPVYELQKKDPVDFSLSYKGDPEVILTANEIHWRDHILMVAACIPHLNGSISKTINMSSEATVEDVEEAYLMAWELGLKGITVYRDGCKGMQPLSDANKKKKIKAETKIVYQPTRNKLPVSSKSIRHKIDIAGFEGYLHVGLYKNGEPGEIFIRASKQGSFVLGMLDAFATMVSIAMQYGVPLKDLVDKFKGQRFEPNGITQNEDIRFCTSIIDYIFKWLENNFLSKQLELPLDQIKEEKQEVKNRTYEEVCPECGGFMQQSGTCRYCTNCGLSNGCS